MRFGQAPSAQGSLCLAESSQYHSTLLLKCSLHARKSLKHNVQEHLLWKQKDTTAQLTTGAGSANP